jgi:hypothetical protein
MPKQTLAILPQCFTIHSFAPDIQPPTAIFSQEVYFIGRTHDELSVVVPSTLELPSLDLESGWRCLEVLGPLALSLTGIIAGIATVLSQADVSIFSVSTFDTDYILVKDNVLAKTITALETNGYKINQLV